MCTTVVAAGRIEVGGVHYTLLQPFPPSYSLSLFSLPHTLTHSITHSLIPPTCSYGDNEQVDRVKTQMEGTKQIMVGGGGLGGVGGGWGVLGLLAWWG